MSFDSQAHYIKTKDLLDRTRGFDPDEKRRKVMLDRRYGTGTYEQVVAWNEEQDCLCAICKGPQNSFYGGMRKHLTVDHCHNTGKVRGLICSECNQALGHFNDNPEFIRAAIRYLKDSTQ